jgi:anti-sigma regulatory factor (Ser/Thr protein kinase)
MDIQKIILEKIKKKGSIKVADIVKSTGFSRAYINRFFNKLKNEGKIILIGKANQAHYLLAKKKNIEKAKKQIFSFRRILKNINLSEDLVLDEIKASTGIFSSLPKNIAVILEYAFTEMLNNAIEHSQSPRIIVSMELKKNMVSFEVVDVGIGIFNNIMKKRGLKNELEAIQDLLKGKQTTRPEEHTGEGIFFTSKVGDKLIIQSSEKKLIFDNLLNDIFIRDVKKTKGTKVKFEIGRSSKRNLADIFKEYTDESFEFGKTKVKIFLYQLDTIFISRSQARRILSGLEKFKEIVLDFEKVETIGQAFADEVFRVWQGHHPQIKVIYQNANENINFMIKRAMSGRG